MHDVEVDGSHGVTLGGRNGWITEEGRVLMTDEGRNSEYAAVNARVQYVTLIVEVHTALSGTGF